MAAAAEPAEVVEVAEVAEVEQMALRSRHRMLSDLDAQVVVVERESLEQEVAEVQAPSM